MTLQSAVAWFQTNSVLGALAIFCVIAVAAYWPSRRTVMQSHAMIPLNDDR